jgi:hypothetical protein
MSESCRHCSNGIDYNFCAHCGQKRAKRIDRNYIKDELQYTVFHMNKGFLYSVKSLLKYNGKCARAFIDGDRVNHYKPLLLVFVLAGIAAFLSSHWVDAAPLIKDYYAAQNIKSVFDPLGYYNFVMKYYSLIFLASVPIMAIFTWLVFRKWGHNYYEHVILNSYFLSYYLIINILIIIPLQVILKHGDLSVFINLPTTLGTLLLIAQAVIFFLGFYNDRDRGQVILKLFYTSIILLGTMIIVSIAVGIAFAFYLVSKGIKPEEVFGNVQTAKDSIQLIGEYNLNSILNQLLIKSS